MSFEILFCKYILQNKYFVMSFENVYIWLLNSN